MKRLLPDLLIETVSKLKFYKEKHRPSDIFPHVDWSNSYAYSLGTTGNIYINMKGREPFGIVEPGKDYEAICERIKQDLMSFEDPDNGKKIIERIYKKQELIHGKSFNEAPDLIVQFSKGYRNMAKGLMRGKLSESDKIIIQDRWTGDHELHGILIMNGPLIKKEFEMQGASIFDITPTVLHLLGVPVPDDMDGNVLVNVIDSDFVLRNPIKYTKVIGEEKPFREKADYKDDEAQKVKERLKALGYLE